MKFDKLSSFADLPEKGFIAEKWEMTDEKKVEEITEFLKSEYLWKTQTRLMYLLFDNLQDSNKEKIFLNLYKKQPWNPEANYLMFRYYVVYKQDVAKSLFYLKTAYSIDPQRYKNIVEDIVDYIVENLYSTYNDDASDIFIIEEDAVRNAFLLFPKEFDSIINEYIKSETDPRKKRYYKFLLEKFVHIKK